VAAQDLRLSVEDEVQPAAAAEILEGALDSGRDGGVFRPAERVLGGVAEIDEQLTEEPAPGGAVALSGDDGLDRFFERGNEVGVTAARQKDGAGAEVGGKGLPLLPAGERARQDAAGGGCVEGGCGLSFQLAVFSWQFSAPAPRWLCSCFGIRGFGFLPEDLFEGILQVEQAADSLDGCQGRALVVDHLAELGEERDGIRRDGRQILPPEAGGQVVHAEHGGGGADLKGWQQAVVLPAVRDLPEPLDEVELFRGKGVWCLGVSLQSRCRRFGCRI
jgi:hypothetical protein